MTTSLSPERALIRVLQHACSGELAAGFAYRGHAGSVTSAQERERLSVIESEEWHHRDIVQGLLAQLGARPNRMRERIFWLIGKTIGAACHIGGWFIPMYGAGRLERWNIKEYELAARFAYEAGRTEMIDCLLTMAEVEWEHERYFRETIAGHFLQRIFPAWDPPPAKESIRRRYSGRLIPESLFIVTVDQGQISVCDPGGNERNTPWTSIERVLIRTTDEGPLLPDVFWIIEPIDQPALVFPGGATGESEALRALQANLPGFRNDSLSAAMSSTANQEFVLWERDSYCSRCGANVPRLNDLNHARKLQVRSIRDTAGPIAAIKLLRELSGCDLKTAAAWVHHAGVAGQGHEPLAPCPYCGQPLRSAQAKQCRFCRNDWHGSEVRKLGANRRPS